MKKLNGKIAAVTGGGYGMGRSVSMLFSQHGAKIAVMDINIQSANGVAEKINKSGGHAVAIECDAANEVHVKKAFDEAISAFGKIDIVHANVGIVDKKQFIPETPLEDWNRIVSVNLTSAFLTAKYAIRQMLTQSGGNIIFTASNWAFIHGEGFASYSATKGGVVSLARGLALDHAKDNIRINVICPGDTDTAFMDNALKYAKEHDPAGFEELSSTEFVGQMSTPEEIANLVLFLASDDSSALKGAVIIIDHGQTLGYGPGLASK